MNDEDHDGHTINLGPPAGSPADERPKWDPREEDDWYPPHAPSTPVDEAERPNRGDEVQIAGAIGNIVRMNDREGTCDIAWWMPAGGPGGHGESLTTDVPFLGLHIRQRATTSRPAPPVSPPVPEPDLTELREAFDLPPVQMIPAVLAAAERLVGLAAADREDRA